MNEFALYEFVLGGMVIAVGVFATVLCQPLLKIFFGVPLISVGLLGIYLGFMCLKK